MFALCARGELPSWIRNLEAKTDLERVFFRAMRLPYGEVVFRRPPAETRVELGSLVNQKPNDGDLYSLRALEDEQQLDFAAGEKDWKLYAEKAKNKPSALTDLADFYHRRLRPQDEISTLRAIADASSDASEKFTSANEQRSWRAFERILTTIRTQALGKDLTIATYRAWLARYPKQDDLYARFLDYLLAEKEFAAARQLVADHRREFPGDEIFPVKAEALVAYKQGSIQQGLTVYEQSYQPLWQPELVKGYFDLLAQTQSLRKFLDQARVTLNKNPQDLQAASRVFYYYQQQGKMDAAEQAITSLRAHKEAAKSPWTHQELYTCGRLLEQIHAYPEAARFYFALYNSNGAPDSQERALARLTDILLTAPESPIRLGAGELSLYKDIATMDEGPGYLNGILSLILNGTLPESAYSEEEQHAVSYFHRARAAELLVLLDKTAPNSPSLPDLHAKLLEFYAANSQSEAVLKGGRQFLDAFPRSPDRTRVALLMAEAYARLGRTQDEFAIYDAALQELAAQSAQMPLGKALLNYDHTSFSNPGRYVPPSSSPQEESETGDASEAGGEQGGVRARTLAASAALQINRPSGVPDSGPRSPEYSRVLERYLARLVELKEIPRALGVLRREIDHNPDDPGLYERLAAFLQQNDLFTEQDEIYRRAFARFSDPSWYSKLARLYLRYQKYSALEKLTEDAVKQFDGSDLQNYFSSVNGGTPQLYLRLNQYANARFPHNLYFVHNLLDAYLSTPTYDHAAWLRLLQQHWFEDSGLRNQYFGYLSATNQLDRELQTLLADASGTSIEDLAKNNPAAALELADAEQWRCHFEQSAPALKALAEVYPADKELDRAASSVYRSLAYYDASKAAVAVKIEDNLLAVNPGDTEMLARIGDIYSDHDLFAQAAPYWERIPLASPGESGGYLAAATIYWDYFDFPNALRLLDEGRRKLHDPALYGYEEGAIYESKREYSRAVQEYTSAALASDADSPALLRLLELARRPKLRDLINDATEKAAVDSNYSFPAINLRVRVLEAQARKQDLLMFLSSAVEHAATMEQAAAVESLAQQKSLETVREKALERQASLATDPVTQLQLHYALVRFYEGRKDLVSAQRNIDALYQSNSKILGVVRSTVDFYWRAKQYPQAIAVLRQAAKDAYPEMAKQFSFEAARKSTEAGEFSQARILLDALLKDSPYDSSYLAAMADTYARAGEAQGLKQFYLDKITLFRSAPFTGDERKTRTATLRRGLIPALTQLKDYPGAVDQYIEVLNNFPEDEALTSEAALYAQRYHRESQLLDFYAKTIQQSPRDYRWPMVLARTESSQEDFAAAIDSYSKALAIRPDRADLRTARATLEERLQRFDDAAADYDRLYQLTYKDAKWMDKLAEVRARQGRTADAVAALKAARIDPGSERAANYFDVSSRLESWGLLDQAKSFAEQGLKIAGGELLAIPENHEGARLYARIMTRLRNQQEAFNTLQAAVSAASDTLPVLKEQVARQGLSAVTDREYREHLRTARKQTAENGMRAALLEMGAAVARYFTPEEKVAFADFAQKMRASMDDREAFQLAIPLAGTAGLADLEGKWRFEVLLRNPGAQDRFPGLLTGFEQLQRQRLKFADLGAQLEQIGARENPLTRPHTLQLAAAAYRSAGDKDNELRVLSGLGPMHLYGENQTRWFELLLEKNRAQLVSVASAWTPFGQAGADFAIAKGDPELAQAVVASRGHSRPPVWSKSFTALAGLYFADPRPFVKAAFDDVLVDPTIGGRLGKAANRDQQLAGDLWFYYAGRYGEYLDRTRLSGAEDFLPAELEHTPASADAYQSQGDYYLEQGNVAKAIEEYQYTLELQPNRASVHDKLAVAYFRQKNRAQAVAQWKLFFAAQLDQVNRNKVEESFWPDFGASCDHLRARGVFLELKPQVDALVRRYLQLNGNYRSNAVLHSVYAAYKDPAAATAWLIEVSSAAPDSVQVLQDIAEISWIPAANRAPIFQKILEGLRAKTQTSQGLAQENARYALLEWQKRWVNNLIATGQYSQASDLLAAMRKEASESEALPLVPLEINCAAKLGALDAVLRGYRDDPHKAPPAQELRTAARQLFAAGDKKSARKLLEFVFARDIEEHQLQAANFLGLAEIRLADGDTAGAVSLLKRLVLVVGDAYQNMDSAAALLEKTSHPREAITFLEPLVQATPWDAQFRLRLAKAQLAVTPGVGVASQELTKIAASPTALYATRVQAATAVAGTHPAGDFGSAELKLLASGSSNITAAAVERPFLYAARLAAAQTTPAARGRMQILAGALADQPSRDEARLPFFRAAISISQDELALASIDQLLRDQLSRRRYQSETADEEILTDDDSSADENNSADAESPAAPPSGTLTPAQQAQLARQTGTACLRLNRLSEAVDYLQTAYKLETSQPEKAKINADLQEAKARLRRLRQNAARQPILHADLDQDRRVRPRFVAKNVKPDATAGSAGAKP